jgi:hypothetical protein
MALHPNFPDDPHAFLDPAIRWFPADEALREKRADQLMAPLVPTLGHKRCQGQKRCRIVRTLFMKRVLTVLTFFAVWGKVRVERGGHANISPSHCINLSNAFWTLRRNSRASCPLMVIG